VSDTIGDIFVKTLLYELKSIRDSWYKILLITILPLLSFGLIIAIFHSGVARDIPIAVVDSDHSALSRALLADIEASPTIDIAYTSTTVKEAIDLVKKTKVYGVVIIPNDFERDALLQKQPKVTAMLNTQYILIGKILTSALTTTLMQNSAKVEYLKSLATTQNSLTSIKKIVPIGIQVTPFFNIYQNYFYFLASALIPAIWQIFIVVTTLVSIGLIFKHHQASIVFEDGRYMATRLIALMLPYSVAFTLMGVLYLLYIYSSWAFQGSFALLMLGIFLTVVAYQVIAFAFFAIAPDYARSLSLGAVYTAPAFAFLGVTFPIYNMNDFALFWRDILPVSHYIELQISQANYGADISWEGDKLLALLSFWILFLPVVWVFRYRVKRVQSI